MTITNDLLSEFRNQGKFISIIKHIVMRSNIDFNAFVWGGILDFILDGLWVLIV